MKSSFLLAAASLASAAPIVTVTYTAPAVTVWVTEYSSSSTTDLAVISSSPPTTQQEPTESTQSTESTEPTQPTQPTPETTTSIPTTSATTPSAATPSAATSSAASSPTGATNVNNDYQFNSDILSEHNAKRALHGVPDLTWDDTLATYAMNYANTHFDCNNVQLIHSGGPYGENLAAGYSGGKSPVDAWYDEIKDYDFSNPGFSESTGHFTQVVWKSTSKLGCARVTCNNAWGQYTICEYTDTRGNIVGTDSNGKSFFANNVLPLV